MNGNKLNHFKKNYGEFFFWWFKTQNSNLDQTQIVTNHKNANFDNRQKVKWLRLNLQNIKCDKTKIVTKLSLPKHKKSWVSTSRHQDNWLYVVFLFFYKRVHVLKAGTANTLYLNVWLSLWETPVEIGEATLNLIAEWWHFGF